eukprot:CAMPEP_0175071790 /NCGR_PEP_ID=MMETSP0052_2-20121109/19461_1 /TAXON_ID=51329 ORGANISM="Polytomella parva, Strain SAG 63-3" /NCGR_SAMPLE_ID=MMETSP0052_2 /ASSEMBLY_ACC=CAM_ASM_000194 /LENGTH=64 /DNA_ID=CAMNT_0016339045 /DNA_START=115 /DNA_END=309 /DNA_ORIENTATION=+
MKRMKSKKDGQSITKCLVRANDGKRHVSTAVDAGDYLKFTNSMIVIMKAHMSALKKREKKKNTN